MNISPGAESVSLIVDIVDDSGLPVTGLVAATFPPVYIVRAGEAVPTAVTLSDLADQDSAYSSGGVKELVGGSYRFDAPDSAFATANPEVKIKGEATDKRLIHPSIKVAYEAVDLQTIKTQSVTCGADVTVSPYVGSTGEAVNGTAANTLSGHDPGATLGTSTFDHTNDQVSLSSAAIQAIWQAAVASITTAGSIGKRIVDYLTGDAFARLGAPAGASVSADIAAVKAETASILDDTDLIDDATSGLAKIATDVAAILGDTNELQTNQGNWLTATGFSTHSAADVWSVATRVLTANTNLNDPTAGAIADAVWDEALSGHLTSGSTGNALNAAGAAGDPWSTSLPGAYGAGTAGYILGTNIDATVSSRLADGDYTAPPSAASIRSEIDSNSTKLADIVADTNELQTDWANGGRLDLILDARSSQSSVDTIGTTTAKLATMIESDGAGGWEWTSASLTNVAEVSTGTIVVYISSAAVAASGAAQTGALTIIKHSDWSHELTGLGSLANAAEILFTVKVNASDDDDDAVFQISNTRGLVRVNAAAAADSSLGELEATNTVTGIVAITLNHAVTALLEAHHRRYYSVKIIRTDGSAVELTDQDPDADTIVRILHGRTHTYAVTP